MILQIADHHYDTKTGSLTGPDGSIVRLRRQSSEVLVVLAAQHGEVVSREHLIEAVWKDVATTDDSLVQCVADIRRAIGKTAIETFPKIGYRLVASPTTSLPGVQRSPVLLAAVGVLVLLLVGFTVWSTRNPPDVPDPNIAIVPPRIVPERTLAVLPFVNLNGGEAKQFLGDGLSEDLTTDLSKIADLTVISYASSNDFAEAEMGFRDIAENLGVRYLVRGTIRHSDDRVRINVALIDPFEGTNVWAERFDRVEDNPFDLQERVTRSIVEALSLTLEVEDQTTHAAPDAFFMLLRGLEPLREHTRGGNRLARDFFRRALEFEPNYARAHAYIAVAHGRDMLFNYSSDPGHRSIEDGLQAAITAIQLDPDLPSAYFALAILNLAIGDHDKSLAAARHSIRINNSFADGYAILAEAGVYGGDLDEALEAVLRAKRLNPHYPASYDWIEGHIRYQLGDFLKAQPLLESTIEMTPGFVPAFMILAAVYSEISDHKRAVSVMAAVQAQNPGLQVEQYLKSIPYASQARLSQLASSLRKIETQ